jgi:hypothetical protein
MISNQQNIRVTPLITQRITAHNAAVKRLWTPAELAEHTKAIAALLERMK